MPSPRVGPGALGLAPAVRFSGYGRFAGFLHHSEHKVLHEEELYPTALHLYEALKFLSHRPDIAKRIRHCERPEEVYAISSSEAESTRPDWHIVAIQMMDTVLHQKFRQHGDLRALLLDTHPSDLIYAERDDPFWGEGPEGVGSNELGKALMRVRDKLRAEAGLAP
ncbi:DUF1768-domain-containing protein [Auriscalpium vulgare]|uniref:DUF1768-domain-containing protein n=1 Tax=Auriscalpium vulgare TaxID=40419 RepID=A0ACB8RHI6_9AGAM|nr:DUF1768-domain-containing protein [Auriscalpium vulgare]